VSRISIRPYRAEDAQHLHAAACESVDDVFPCGINQLNRIHRFGNLGYWVRSSKTGRGVAVSAVTLAARFAFQSTDLIRLEIVCAVGNRRSQRVAEKAGAMRESVLHDRLLLHGAPHDAVMYSIVRPR
jgi:RimJ/RimL family protein N-acetyltransferase